ncbi:6376_t:CDS:2, partial [Dentiscutata heterogama]
GFYSSNSQVPTLASSPPSASGLSFPTFHTQMLFNPQNFELGTLFSIDNSSTEVTSSNMPKYGRSSSYRGKNRKPGYKMGGGNESRNLMSIPKTGSFEGSDSSRMMIPAESTFDFQIEKPNIPSIQPTPTSSIFKFNQEIPSVPTEPMFTTNGTTSNTFNFQSSFSSQSSSTPVTFGNSFGLNLNQPETPTTFSTVNNSSNSFMSINGSGQLFQNGTNIKSSQPSNIDGREIRKMRKPRVK